MLLDGAEPSLCPSLWNAELNFLFPAISSSAGRAASFQMANLLENIVLHNVSVSWLFILRCLCYSVIDLSQVRFIFKMS